MRRGRSRVLADARAALDSQPNYLNRGIRRALDDMSGYYLIGYRPNRLLRAVTGRHVKPIDVKVKALDYACVRALATSASREGARPVPRRGRTVNGGVVSPSARRRRPPAHLLLHRRAGRRPPSAHAPHRPPPAHFLSPSPTGRDYQSRHVASPRRDGRVIDQINRARPAAPPDSLERSSARVSTTSRARAYAGRLTSCASPQGRGTRLTGSASQYVACRTRLRAAHTSGLVFAAPQGQRRRSAVCAIRRRPTGATRFPPRGLLDYASSLQREARPTTGRRTDDPGGSRRGESTRDSRSRSPRAAFLPGRVEAAGRIPPGPRRSWRYVNASRRHDSLARQVAPSPLIGSLRAVQKRKKITAETEKRWLRMNLNQRCLRVPVINFVSGSRARPL